MITAAGVFSRLATAERAVRDLYALGIRADHVDLLTPGATEEHLAGVPTADSEQPGMGAAVGTVVGGAVGLASGLTIGTAAAVAVLVPGIGAVLAAGALGAAVLGTVGAVGGGMVGQTLDRALLDGLPKDEIFIYEDALRQGRTVVICLARDETEREEARRVLARHGAESIDAARHRWWTGLRDAERAHYEADGLRFETDEELYRRGFELALHPEFRGRSWDQALYVIVEREKDWPAECLRKGYERGQRYYRSLLEPR